MSPRMRVNEFRSAPPRGLILHWQEAPEFAVLIRGKQYLLWKILCMNWYYCLLLLFFFLLQLHRAYAQSGDNRIVRENRQPGTQEWLLTKVDTVVAYKSAFGTEVPYLARSKRVEGYVNNTRYGAGDTVQVFVSTDPVADFSLDIYRLGYYQGEGGRKMQSFTEISGQTQPTPVDGQRGLREARWEPSLSFEIPEEWVSGVYLGKLTELEEGYQAYVVFVVRESIWNTQGGNIISFDRPYSFYYNDLPSIRNPLTNGSGEFLLWEHPLTFWLEREGYDVTYTSNLDTHEDAEGLLRVKAFLSVGHDEYWTRQMYNNVCQARDAGLNLLFLSGNSLSGEIFLTTSTDGQKNRTMGRAWIFPDEQELMGASSYGVGLGDWTVRQADHWIFEDSGLKNGDVISDLVGWEYHGPPLKEDSSLIVLATSELDEEWDSDPNTYTTTIYTGPKGNFVFNAATCWWNLPLSSPPGFRNPPNKDFTEEDARVQQITRNLLEKAIAIPRPSISTTNR
jgi:hypothetical protein